MSQPSLSPGLIQWRMTRVVNLIDDGLLYPDALVKTAVELQAFQVDGVVLPKLRKFEGVPA